MIQKISRIEDLQASKRLDTENQEDHGTTNQFQRPGIKIVWSD